MRILFPDDKHVLSAENIEYRQATIAPSEPVIRPEYHWETPRTNMYGSVFKSERGYEMFYQCGNAVRVAYARSDDGLHWEKPLLNETDLNSLKHDRFVDSKTASEKRDETTDEKPTIDVNNMEATNIVAGYHMPSVLYESGTEFPYKIFAFGEEGYRVAGSKNGQQFQEYPDNPAIELMTFKNESTGKTWCSDVSPCFAERDGKGVAHYIAMTKTYEDDQQQRTRRCVGQCSSRDFTTWSTVRTIWVPGESEDRIARQRGFNWADFYGLCPFRYGSGYLGFLWLFEIEKELPHGTHQGKIEVFLACSPDGTNWRRLSDEPLIPWDLNFGESGGMVTTPSSPIFDDDEIKLYYSDSNYEHGFYERDFTKDIAAPEWVIRCARIPKERLVGAYGVDGIIKLAPLDLTHKKLRLNLDCREGKVTVDYFADADFSQPMGTAVVELVDDPDFCIPAAMSGNCFVQIRLQNAIVYALEFMK